MPFCQGLRNEVRLGMMFRDISVQDAPPIMTDAEEAVEHAERNRWHSEEIHGGNRFPMIAKEG